MYFTKRFNLSYMKSENSLTKTIVKKEINKILPLPRLGEFTPLENELY